MNFPVFSLLAEVCNLLHHGPVLEVPPEGDFKAQLLQQDVQVVGVYHGASSVENNVMKPIISQQSNSYLITLKDN